MEKITIIIDSDAYYNLRDSGHINKNNHEVKYVDEPYDYSNSEQWKEAKKESDKYFKKLKEIEFSIRNKS